MTRNKPEYRSNGVPLDTYELTSRDRRDQETAEHISQAAKRAVVDAPPLSEHQKARLRELSRHHDRSRDGSEFTRNQRVSLQPEATR